MSSRSLAEWQSLRQPGRKVEGISAVLLPYDREARMDEAGFRRHLARTLCAGLRPAVNMDTGFVDLLTAEEKRRVLGWTAETAGAGGFVAGALPAPGAEGSVGAYCRECEAVAAAGGTPIVFPSPFTAALDDDALAAFYQEIGRATAGFLAFELGTVFNPNGRVFSERVFRAVVEIPQCLGLKHSSLDRALEAERVVLRDRMRPEFRVYSGNDLAADMIEYGSDYLLGLSTFAPELFAARDRAWAESHDAYFELRDFIQYLGWIAFRDPVPAYKHSAAMFLKLSAGLDCDEPHPRAVRRDDWDRELLAEAARRLKRIDLSLGTEPAQAAEGTSTP